MSDFNWLSQGGLCWTSVLCGKQQDLESRGRHGTLGYRGIQGRGGHDGTLGKLVLGRFCSVWYCWRVLLLSAGLLCTGILCIAQQLIDTERHRRWKSLYTYPMQQGLGSLIGRAGALFGSPIIHELLTLTSFSSKKAPFEAAYSRRAPILHAADTAPATRVIFRFVPLRRNQTGLGLGAAIVMDSSSQCPRRLAPCTS